MKKTLLSALSVLLPAAFVSAQGLYNLMPYDDEAPDTLPLNWTVGLSIGYDDNPSPLGSDLPGGGSDGEVYADAFVQGNYVNRNPQTTWDVWARLGVTYYFDAIPTVDGTGTIVDSEDTFWGLRGGLNFVHRVNERLRFRSRSTAAYETEPDFAYGLGTDRRQGQYVRWSSDNSVGYRWTERFGTNTGWRIYGVSYDDIDGSDYVSNLFYNEFRYRATPQTVYTAAYRYQMTDDDAIDSDSQYFLVGAEHQFSPTTVGVLRVGGQYFEPDLGSDTWAPYVEGMIRSQINEQLSIRSFVRYGIEGYDRNIAIDDFGDVPFRTAIYDDNSILRIGAQGSYAVSPRFTVFGGGHLIHRMSSDGIVTSPGILAGTAAPDYDETTLNLNIGGSMQVSDNVYVTGSYNFTTASADSDLREYDRNRVQLGVQATF